MHWLIDRVAKLRSPVGGLAGLGPLEPPPCPPLHPPPLPFPAGPAGAELLRGGFRAGCSVGLENRSGSPGIAVLPASARHSAAPGVPGEPPTPPRQRAVTRKAQGPEGEGREQGNIWKFLILEMRLANAITPPPSLSSSQSRGRGGGGAALSPVRRGVSGCGRPRGCSGGAPDVRPAAPPGPQHPHRGAIWWEGSGDRGGWGVILMAELPAGQNPENREVPPACFPVLSPSSPDPG